MTSIDNLTLRWQLKGKVSSTTPPMGGHICWKFQDLSNHAQKLQFLPLGNKLCITKKMKNGFQYTGNNFLPKGTKLKLLSRFSQGICFLTTFINDICPNSSWIKGYGPWSWEPLVPEVRKKISVRSYLKKHFLSQKLFLVV